MLEYHVVADLSDFDLAMLVQQLGAAFHIRLSTSVHRETFCASSVFHAKVFTIVKVSLVYYCQSCSYLGLLKGVLLPPEGNVSNLAGTGPGCHS